MKKIGIMGGTFNPIHMGHIALAEAAYKHCGLDEVWFMPSGVSYLKSHDNVLSGEQRLEMCRLAVEEYPYFKCSDMEVRREGNTYTADTLEQLHREYPEAEFFFILGADALLGLPKWKAPDKIAAMCTLVSVVRDDVDDAELLSQKMFLEMSLGARVILVPFHKVDISSSDIREQFQAGENANDLIPEKVLEYIHRHGLYTEVE